MEAGGDKPERDPYEMTAEERQRFIAKVRRELPELDRQFAEATAEIDRLNRLRFGRHWRRPVLESSDGPT